MCGSASVPGGRSAPCICLKNSRVTRPRAGSGKLCKPQAAIAAETLSSRKSATYIACIHNPFAIPMPGIG